MLNCYRKHRHRLKAFKAGFDALSDSCVMNTGEGTGHDDLTRLPGKPTAREMVSEKNNRLQRIANRISAAFFDNHIAGDVQRNSDVSLN